jgi:uncharacterized protein
MTAQDFPIQDLALDDRQAIVGSSGSGKTYTGGAMVERVLDLGGRVIIIDLLGVWWGLRLAPDGATPSKYKPVIFGGSHGDLPITEHAGHLIGETVAGMAESCIIDLTQIGTKAGERRFMLAFLSALYRKHESGSVHLVIDEADMYAPQKLLDKDGEAAKLLGMMETIVRRGRIKGFIPWLITQRPAVLSKDVLSQADGVIAMKLTASQDRAAIGAWIEGQGDREVGKEILASLPSKQRGEGVVWNPSRGILEHATFPLKKTFDSSRAPKRGEARPDASLKPLDLGALKDRLTAIEAETKANDPKALKAQIAKLRKEAIDAEKLRNVPQVDTREIAAAAWKNGHAVGYEKGFSNGVLRISAAIENTVKNELGELALFETQSETTEADLAKLTPKPFSKLPSRQEQADMTEGRSIAPNKAAPPRSRVHTAEFAEKRYIPGVKDTDGLDLLPGPQRRILSSLAFWKSLGHNTPTRQQVALIAGYSPTSSSYKNPLSNLNANNHIGYPSPGSIELKTDWPNSVDDPRQMFWSVLPGPQTRIVKGLLDGDCAREVLAERSDYSATSSSFKNPLSNLRSLGIIDYPAPNHVALADWAREVLA